MATALSFSDVSQGWVSFHSYNPEWMENLGSNFYSFKNGDLYLHDDNNTRAKFYGTSYSSTITFSVNKGASDVKVFKAMKLETDTSGWSADLTSEMESGEISSSSWSEKERMFYAYIRRKSTDKLNYNELSIQGIGELDGDPSGLDLTFTSDIPNQVGAANTDGTGGDELYFEDSSDNTIKRIGVIDTYDGKTITILTSFDNTPADGDFCFVVKDPQSESYGLRGFHAIVKLSYSGGADVELFAANTEVFQSYM